MFLETSKIRRINSCPGLSAGCALPGKNNLDRPLLVLEDCAEPIEIAKQQIGALVSGEPTGKADGERLRVEQLLDAAQVIGRGA